TTTLRIVANTPALQQILKQQLHVAMEVKKAEGSPGPGVPDGTTVQSIGPAANPGFNFTRYEFAPGSFDTVLAVQLNHPIDKSGTKEFPRPAYGYALNRATADYVTTALVKLWYTWAQYYVDHASSTPPGRPIRGDSLTTDNGHKTNRIQLKESAKALGLVPGMLVTGSTIPNSPPGQF